MLWEKCAIAFVLILNREQSDTNGNLNNKKKRGVGRECVRPVTSRLSLPLPGEH